MPIRTLSSGTSGGGASDASQVACVPVGGIASTNVQAAIAELDTEKANATHTHAESDVTGLATSLSGKAATTHAHATSDVTGLDTVLTAKAAAADLTSHTGDTTVHVTSSERTAWNAKTDAAYVDTRIQAVIGAAPTALDTLKEIDDALGNDASFATTITNALAGKAATTHNHAGVYEPVDATILRQGNLAGGGVATTPARSDHAHSGTYEPVDTTLLRQGNLAGTGSATTPAKSDHNHDSIYATLAHTHTGIYEPAYAAGTTGQYYRGDKSWATLDKAAVGLGSVENTALSTWAGSANIATVGTITSGTWSGTAIAAAKQTVMVGDSGAGGTQGAVPAPASGDAAAGKFLKANGTWAAPTASFAWATTAAGTSGTGFALTVSNSASAGTIGQSIVIGNTQTQSLTGLSIDTGTSSPGSQAGHTGIRISHLGGIDAINNDGAGILLNCYASATQAVGSSQAGISIGKNFNTSTTISSYGMWVVNEANAGDSYNRNTGILVVNNNTGLYNDSASSKGWRGAGISIAQQGAGGTSIAIYGSSNVASSTNGLVNCTLSNTQSGATVMQKIDLGTSAQAHTGLLIKAYGASSTQCGIAIDGSTTSTGVGIEFNSASSFGANGYKGISWKTAVNNTNDTNSRYGIYQATVVNSSVSSAGFGYGFYQGTICSGAGGAIGYGLYQNTMENNGGIGYGIYQNIIASWNGTSCGWYVANIGLVNGTKGNGGKYFSLNNAQSGTLEARTNDASEILFSRTNTATTGTVADNFNLSYWKRTNVQNGAGGTLTATGSVLKLENVATQTAGTLTDTVAVLSLVQGANSVGGHILFNAYSGTPTVNNTLWYDGTNLKYINNAGVTKTVTVT